MRTHVGRWSSICGCVALAVASEACGPRPAAAPGPVVVGNVDDEPTADAPADPGGADPGCVADCLAGLDAGADADDALHAYCDARCAPVDEPSPTCVDGCMAANEPGGYYDDDGEYQREEDLRTAEDVEAERIVCADACATVPYVGPREVEACAQACEAAGGGTFERCMVDCDPDPYDECRYLPCD